jgi:hypothetical protein
MSHATCERAKKIMIKGSDDQKQAFRYAGVVTRKVCGQLQCDERNEELREESRLVSSDKQWTGRPIGRSYHFMQPENQDVTPMTRFVIKDNLCLYHRYIHNVTIIQQKYQFRLICGLNLNGNACIDDWIIGNIVWNRSRDIRDVDQTAE